MVDEGADGRHLRDGIAYPVEDDPDVLLELTIRVCTVFASEIERDFSHLSSI
jgi:hypothetical protein